MEQLYNYLPRELITFVLVTLFSLLIGLSQRRISLKREGETTLFGTDRTFSFIGILGYLLYIRCSVGSVVGAELLRQAVSIPCLWCNDHYYCADYLLSGSYCVYPAFLVLCDGDCDGAFIDRA